MNEQEWENAKSDYEKIETPHRLKEIIEMEINKDKKLHQKKGNQYKKWLTAAACAALFVGAVNVSPSVAMAMYKVPVLGEVARVVTLRNYKYHDPYVDINVQVPKIEGTGNESLEKRINDEIDSRMKQVIDAQQMDAQQRKAFAKEQGYSEADIYQKGLFADYEVKCQKDDILSFVITTVETAGSSDTKAYYYNINLKTGQDISLAERLGQDYKSKADAQIYKQIEERMQSDESQIFFGYHPEDAEIGVKGFEGIAKDQTFYINENGNVVITFEKYQIAPGYMGVPEFEIIADAS